MSLCDISSVQSNLIIKNTVASTILNVRPQMGLLIKANESKSHNRKVNRSTNLVPKR